MPDVVTFIDPDGDSISLSDDPYIKIARGASGRFMPPIQLTSDVVPFQDGQRLRNVRRDLRNIFYPLLITGASESDLRTRLRSLLRRFDPVRGDGTLQVSSNGETREITCRYAEGLEVTEEQPASALWKLAPVVFRAFDPFWQDAEDSSLEFSGLAPSGTFFPFFPLTLGSDTLSGGATVDNSGDVDAWPVWTIQGPGGPLTLTNETTGKALTLDTVLTGVQSVTIDTRPGEKTITRDDGTNLYPDLHTGSSLWPLVPGENTVDLSMTGATSATTVSLSFRRRFLSA
jgi:hypothetical protein